MSNQTYNALMSRGINSDLAYKLIHEGYTIETLSQENDTQLKKLGLSQVSIEYLHKKRPPIPDEVRIKLIYQTRNVCCVCRGTNSKSVVIHHIQPWSISHSHDIDNLILLCPMCHDKAHTKHEISQNLTPEVLLGLKQEWLDKIRDDDKKIIKIKKKPKNPFCNPTWDYFNHSRIIEYTGKEIMGFSDFVDKGKNEQYLYSGELRTTRIYHEFVDLLGTLLDSKEYYFVDNHTPLNEIQKLVCQGAIIILTANHRFKRETSVDTGHGQRRLGYFKKHGIKFEFRFDAWECTSCSANGNLSGRWTCTSILLIRSVTKTNDGITCNATCLGIGTGIVPYTSITPEFVAKREYQQMLEEEKEDELSWNGHVPGTNEIDEELQDVWE